VKTARVSTIRVRMATRSRLLARGAWRGGGDTARPDHENAIALNLGLGSAVGLFGFTFDRFLGTNAALERASVGFTSWQLSVMPEPAFGDGRHSFVTGIGAAAANYGDQRDYGPPEHSPKPPVIWWSNADLAGYQTAATVATSSWPPALLGTRTSSPRHLRRWRRPFCTTFSMRP
jgi:hypothetical protein